MTEESAVPRPRIGQVAVVTGGSAGLGFAIAGALARAGSSVLLAGRSAERCQQAADHLIGAMIVGVAADVIGLVSWAWLAVACRRGAGWTQAAGRW